MKQIVRSFSIGLFTAGIVFFLSIYFSNGTNTEDLTVDEMIPMIESEGYHVLTKEEYISLSVNSDDSQKSTYEQDDVKLPNEDKQEELDKTNENTNNVTEYNGNKKQEIQKNKEYNYTLVITAGMVSSTISELLEENKIIDNASAFNNYLNEHNFSRKIQIGKYKLSSEMSFYELAVTITN